MFIPVCVGEQANSDGETEEKGMPDGTWTAYRLLC